MASRDINNNLVINISLKNNDLRKILCTPISNIFYLHLQLHLKYLTFFTIYSSHVF